MALDLYDDALEQLGQTPAPTAVAPATPPPLPFPTSAPAPAAPSPGPLYATARQVLAGNDQADVAQMQTQLGQAPASGDRAAQVLAYADRFKLPPALVERNFDAIAARAQTLDTPYGQILKDTPTLASWIKADPYHAALVRDDAPLSGIERALRAPFDVARNYAAGLVGDTGGGLWGLVSAGADAVGATGVSQFARGSAEEAARLAGDIAPTVPGQTDVERLIMGGARGAGAMLAPMVAGVFTGAPGLLATLGAQTFGSSYGTGRAQNLPAGQAAMYATAQAGTAVLTGIIPAERLLGVFAGKLPFLQAVAHQIVPAVGGAEIATAVQDLSSWASLPANHDKTFNDYLSERPSAAAAAAISTLSMVALDSAPGLLTGRMLENVAAPAAASTTRTSSLSTLENFVGQVVGDTPFGTVHLPVDSFTSYWQSKGEDPKTIATKLTGDPAAYDRAAATGADLAVPTARYVAEIAPTEANAFFSQEARFAPDEMNGREAAARLQEIAANADELAKAEPVEPSTTATSAAAVREDVRAKAAAAAFAPNAAEAYGALAGAAFGTLGERAGVDPLELYNRYGLTIGRTDLEAAAAPGETRFNQVDTSTPAFKDWFGDSVLRDEDNQPEVLYHGTARDFEAFDLNKGGTGRGTRDEGAMFFSRTPETANHSADVLSVMRAEEDATAGMTPAQIQERLRADADANPDEFPRSGGVVYPVHVKLENPYISPMKHFSSDEMVREIAEAKAAGHDGMLFPKLQDPGERDTVAVFKPTQVKSALANAGTFSDTDARMLHQAAGDEGARGFIRFGQDRQFQIGLTPNANLSTFLHEAGHFFLEVQGDLHDELAARDQATLTPEQRGLVEDYQTTLKALGVTSRAELGTEQHETFARLFEAYARDGKAPSAELRPAFARFKSWLVAIYRSLRDLHVNLSDDIRGVFDRLLASDDAIRAAAAEGHVRPLFTDAAAAGMTPEQFDAYRGKVEAASAKAQQDLEQKLLGQYRREQDAWWKSERATMRDQVAAEIGAQPGYRALFAIQRGTHPDGTPLVEGEEPRPLKLSRQALVDQFGPDVLKQLPKPFVYTRAGGLEPDTAAAMLGFSSGDEMVRALIDTPPFKRTVEAETDTRMRATHGDALVDGSLPDRARAAVAADGRDDVIRAELRALASAKREAAPAVKQAKAEGKAALEQEQAERAYERRWLEAEARLRIAIAEGAKQSEIDVLKSQLTALRQAARKAPGKIDAAVPSAASVRDFARDRIAATTPRELRPQSYWAASRRASDTATAAAARGDVDGAIVAKQQELVNLALFREASAARDEVDEIRTYLTGFAAPAARARLGKAGEDYLDQVDGLLDRYQLRPASDQVKARRKTLAEWVAAQQAAWVPLELPADVMNEAHRADYRDVSMDELRGVRDAVKQIAHVARAKNKLIAAADQADLDDVATATEASIRANRPTSPVPIELTPGQARVRKFAGWIAAHTKMAEIAHWLDGDNDAGPMWEHIVRPLNEAATAERQLNRDTYAQIRQLFRDHYSPDDLRRLDERQFIPEIKGSLSKTARLMSALNWGNDGNRQRLMSGNHWTEDQARAVLNTLDARDWKFVQGVWDHLETWWPKISDKMQRVTGVRPEQVEASPVTNRFGTLRGGYFPLAYDGRRAARAESILDAGEAQLQQQVAYVAATTRRGHEQARQEHVTLPVKLDFSVLFRHLEQVTHDLTHHEVLIDVQRVLRDKRVRDAIYETPNGDILYRELKDNIADVAYGPKPASDTVEKSVNFVRHGVTVAGLGWNFWTALQQPVGIFNGMATVGPRWVARGLVRMLRDASTMESTAKFVQEKSAFMKVRADALNREVAELHDGLEVPDGWFDTTIRKVTNDKLEKEDITSSFLWMIEKSQQLADLPSWLGGYEKARAAGHDEARAVALADQAVLDSQGHGDIKDLARVQRGGPWAKLFTTFYSYGNTVLNSTLRAYRKTNFRDVGSTGEFLGNMLLLYTAPAVMTVGLSHLFGKSDDQDSVIAELAEEHLMSALNGLVGVRELAAAGRDAVDVEMTGKAKGTGVRGYEGPSGTRAISDFYELVGSLTSLAREHKNETESEHQARVTKLQATLERQALGEAGLLFHFPAAQVQRTVDGVTALIDGQTSNPFAALIGAPPPPKKGASQ